MGSTGGTNTQNSITQQQIATANQSNALSAQQYQQYQQNIAPAVSYYQSLASGNPSQVLGAAGPQISNITSGYNAATESINNNVGPGAARDYALSQVPLQQNSQVAGTLNSVVQGAYPQLAQIASGQGSFSLQELGASLSGLGGASTSNQSVMQANEEGKAATLGVLGSLLGAGGTAAAGIYHS